MKNNTAVVELVLAAAQVVTEMSCNNESVRTLRMALDTVLATNVEVQAALAELQQQQLEQEPRCEICGSKDLPEGWEVCLRCEDAGDRSDEERYSAEQEERENLAWLAEQEEAQSEPGHCQVCRSTPVPHGVEVCAECMDAGDPSDEQRFAQEEAVLSRMEAREYHEHLCEICSDIEVAQHQLAKCERYYMYLLGLGQGTLSNEEYHDLLEEAEMDMILKKDSIKVQQEELAHIYPGYGKK